MSYLNFKSEYDRFPKTTIKNHKAFHGYDEIPSLTVEKVKSARKPLFKV